MIIGYDFMNKDVQGTFFDTAIPTSHLDEMTIGSGVYDEIFITVDTTEENNKVRPEKWQLKHIMDAKFQKDLEAGSIDADGHEITEIHIYRRKSAVGAKWILVGKTDYNKEYNVYSFTDRTVENGETYEYAIVPIAKSVIGELTSSELVKAEYSGAFISDLQNNYRMDIDFEREEAEHNKNHSILTPLNGKYPIFVYGNQDYETGRISFLPITKEQIDTGGTAIDAREERHLRDKVISFLNSGTTKIFRDSSGEIKLMAITGVKTKAKSSSMTEIRNVSFDYTEIGAVEGNVLATTGLIGQAVKSTYTYDEQGEIVWGI